MFENWGLFYINDGVPQGYILETILFFTCTTRADINLALKI
jgi:hypothetical protein